MLIFGGEVILPETLNPNYRPEADVQHLGRQLRDTEDGAANEARWL